MPTITITVSELRKGDRIVALDGQAVTPATVLEVAGRVAGLVALRLDAPDQPGTVPTEGRRSIRASRAVTVEREDPRAADAERARAALVEAMNYLDPEGTSSSAARRLVEEAANLARLEAEEARVRGILEGLGMVELDHADPEDGTYEVAYSGGSRYGYEYVHVRAYVSGVPRERQVRRALAPVLDGYSGSAATWTDGFTTAGPVSVIAVEEEAQAA